MMPKKLQALSGIIGAVWGEELGGKAMVLCFQVTDVRKPLLAVKRITERGNIVQFGPAENDNFIKKIYNDIRKYTQLH